MKKTSTLFTITIALLLFSISSCKKEGLSVANTAEEETTFELSADQAIADNLTEDANGIFMEAAAKKNLLGNSFSNQPVTTTNILSCASVTVNPAAGFPKSITIDFGTTGCTSANGITHK